MDKRPEFLIVGAMKSGTSELRFQISRQPSIYVAPKELHYFDDDTNFSRGDDWYCEQFPTIGKWAIRGEKTPTYSYVHGALSKIPARIHAFRSDIKLVWIFRNPVDRSYSNYLHSVNAGNEWMTFDDAVRWECKRITSNTWVGYVERSKYAKAVAKYLELFSKDQMHFVLFENFVRDPSATVKGICEFLEVPYEPVEDGILREPSNITRITRSRLFFWGGRRLLGSRSKSFGVWKALLRRRAPGYPPMNDKVRQELEEILHPYNEELAALTGLDLHCWKD